MKKVFCCFFLSFLWLEGVHHIAIYSLNSVQPMFMIMFAVLVAGFESLWIGISNNRKVNHWVFRGIQICNWFLFVIQLVYHNVFTRPLMLEVAFTTGGDALTDFWDVAVDGVIRSLFSIICMMIPIIITEVLSKKEILQFDFYKKEDWITNSCIFAGGILAIVLALVAAYHSEDEFYAEYQEFYAPDELAQEYGILALYGRQLMFDLLPAKDTESWAGGIPVLDESESVGREDTENENLDGTEILDTEFGEEIVTEPEVDTSPQVLNIDFDALISNGNDNIDELAAIMQGMTPSKKNAYTGMMKGYNLIYITAEAFSPYVISEELTPTLYKMVNSGVVVKDYYVPLWNTSTSDGEYVNLFGQIPDSVHSFRRSAKNTYPYGLPKYFEAEGVKSYAYHNNSLNYYDRHITHPNLGYDFKAALSGGLPRDTWGSQIFEMDNPRVWPSSDYDMVVATLPEWIDDERFYAYYMTLSGHCNYDWSGNQMATNNRDLVAHLECSELMKGYIACNYEVERALTYIIEQLELAGKLDTTLIVLSADHHPYGLKDVKGELEAFTGTEMSELDIQKNCLIMWNSQMETVNVEKTCSAIDILPTIMNLFGFEYDSRLFAGRDILSDSPSMVVFSNRSFITDEVIYDAPSGNMIPRTENEVTQEYIEAMKAYVKTMFQYSAGILNEGFDAAVYEAQVKSMEDETVSETESE